MSTNDSPDTLQTCELRWFFDQAPLSTAFFDDERCSRQTRTDWYACPCHVGCGIKIRENRLETKLLVDELGEIQVGAALGRLESWKKWSVSLHDVDSPSEELLRRNGWLSVTKTRWLSSFQVDRDQLRQVNTRPDNGCGFELTKLSIGGKTWWTVGFEAIGLLEHLRDNLQVVAEQVLPHCDTHQFTLGRSFGYPAWLCQLEA